MRCKYLVPLLLFLIGGNVVEATSPYRMEGIVTDVDTGEPVPHTTVQVLIESAANPAEKIRKAVTGEDGRYSIELPAGHGWAWTLKPPAGFAPTEENATEVFATTVENPVFTKNYQVRKGTPIRVLVRHPNIQAALPTTYVSLVQQKGDDFTSGYCELDENGAGCVTLLKPEGKFDIHCGDMKQSLTAPEGMAVVLDRGFYPLDVQEEIEHREDGSIVVTDSDGLTATLVKCGAIVEDHQLRIAFDVDAAKADDQTVQLQGRVLDDGTTAVEGATITLAFYSGGGSASSKVNATTDANGEFSLPIPKLAAEQKVGLTVTAKGFGGIDTEPMEVPADADGAVQVDPIAIEAGGSIRVRVVGPDGTPLHGAVVEPQNDYASRTRIARTGPDGECMLSDLAPGLMSIYAKFGTLYASIKIPLDPGENELVTLRLSTPPTASPTEQQKRPPALAAGTAAPEWTIIEWTDGKDRKLSDYRGKVVVLDFWGVWCSACINGIPAMKELHDRYQDQEVEFLGIHTAGTDMSIVKRLLKQQDWDITVGVDTGDDIVTGETVKHYAIRGFPSTLVIDRQGVIAFNSGDIPEDHDAFMKQVEELAKAAGLPWPIDKDATEEEVKERMNRLLVFMHSREIDKALKTAAE